SAELRKAGTMPGVELRPPVNIHITRLRLRFTFRIGRNQDEFLFEQLLDFQSGATLRSIHDANVYPTLGEPLHEFRLKPALGPNGNLRSRLLHQLQPVHQEFLPQTNSTTNSQCSAKPFRNSDVVAGLFNCSDQCGGMSLKMPAGRRERGTG